MMNQPGYPLPSGDLGSDEIVCQLVFLPNRPEYWQALVGALGFFATWRAWERDEDKRGKDAAANWSTAFEMTMGCWRMACLQSLQDDVAAILAIMETPADCCGESDVTGGDQYTDRVDDGVGDVPQNIIDAGYANDASDWDGFDDYKCMVAHVLVDQIGPRLEAYLPWIDFGGKWLLTITIVAAFATIILTGPGAILAAGIVATTGTIAGLYWALFELESVQDLIDAVAANYDELVCAIYNSDGDEGALVALNDKIDELFSVPEALVLTNMNLGPTLKALYAGRYDQQDIAETLEAAGYDVGDFSCFCEIPELNDWTIYEDPQLLIENSTAPPGCVVTHNKAWQVLLRPTGSNLTGDFRVKGYYHVTGDITHGGDCVGDARLNLKMNVVRDAVSPAHPTSPTYEYEHYSDLTQTPGSQNLRVDFEFTRPFTNVKYLTLTRRCLLEYGDCDIECSMTILEIEHTP